MELDLDQIRKDVAELWSNPHVAGWLNGPTQDATNIARLLKAVPLLLARIDELEQSLDSAQSEASYYTEIHE